MTMTAKVARQTVSLPDLSEFGVEVASDADKDKINKLVKEFLDAFETDYRQKIKERDDK